MTRSHRHAAGIAFVLLSVCTPALFADVAPPAVIRLDAVTPHAVAGEEFTGVFEIELLELGLLQKFEIVGEGWEVLAAEYPQEGFYNEPTKIAIRFKARPSDPEAPIGLKLAYECQTMTRVFRVGPKYLAERGKPFLLESQVGSRTLHPEDDVTRSAKGATTRGGSINLRVTGRIRYARPGVDVDNDGDIIDGPDILPAFVGVDSIKVRLIDEDLVGSETIWTGETNADGTFDSGDVSWDDCDIDGCDDPDLVLEFFTDNDIAHISESGSPLTTYYWTTPEIEDFTGSFHDYGDLTPVDISVHPALHIWNNIIRTNYFTYQSAGEGTSKVEVIWPELTPDGPRAFYDRGTATIHVKPAGQWETSAHAHEYGHHFVISRYTPPSSNYCNSYCDGGGCSWDPTCSDTGHCLWCPENVTDAWNEGFPDWISDATTRWMSTQYVDDLGAPFRPIDAYNFETLDVCCVDSLPYGMRADEEEGHVAALLRDIEDANFDFHPETPWSTEVIRDTSCLGADEIFDVVVSLQPTTVEQFMDYFILLYPNEVADLRLTALNVSPVMENAAGFPADTQPLGLVTSVQSLSHPVGQGGSLPCMTMAWDPPQDDVNGACAYNFGVGPTSAVPLTYDSLNVGSSGCQLTGTAIASSLGKQYFGIRAKECNAGWGADTVFGTFEVLDCNANGGIDLCDISCGHTGDPAICTVGATFCNGSPGCGTSSDCQGNLVPDECDIASGNSADCNENGIPDECESMKHWGGGTGDWNSDIRWVEGVRPVSGDFVCIEDPAQASTVTYRSGDIVVPILASDESVEIANNFQVYAKLTLSEPSWIRGDLILRNDFSRLTVNDRLDVDGSLIWSNSATLGGSGTTYVGGGLNNPSGVAVLENHSLVLLAGTTSVVTRMDGNGSSNLQIRPTASIEFQGTQHLMNYGVMNVEGSLLKTGDWSSSTGAMVYNDGLVHVQDGAFQLTGGGQVTGTLLGDPGTTITVSAHDFLAGSTIQADRLAFVSGCCTGSNIRGSYDVTTRTSNAVNSTVTFHPSATIVNYGTEMILTSGKTYFNAVTGGAVFFDTFTAGGQVYLNSGDPVVTQNFNLSGLLYGTSPVTVNGHMQWVGGGGVAGSNVITSNGTMTVAPGTSQRNIYSTFNNLGLATFQGGIGLLSSSSAFNNLASGVMDFQIDGTIISGGTTTPFNNSGALVKSGGAGTSTISASPATNTGSIEIQAGTLQFYRLTQNAGQILLNGGNFTMHLLTGQPLNLAGGTLTGTGTVGGVVNNSGGSVEPGLSAGTLTLTQNYNQTAAGRYVAELGGLTPGTEHDQLVLTGSATASLAGTLRVELIDGFVPDVGATFDVVVAPNVTGIFDTLEKIGFPADRDIRIIDLDGGVTLQVFDPNCDGVVGGLGLCPGAVCPLIDYPPGGDPELTFADPASCPAGGILPGGAVDFVEGRFSSLGIDAGNVTLGLVAPQDCGLDLDAFLWDGAPPASGEVRFYLARPQGTLDYGQAGSGETRLVPVGDCP